MATRETRRQRDQEKMGLQPGRPALVVKLPARTQVHTTVATFGRLCRANPELRLERTATGKLVVMAPAGSESGGRNSGLTAQLWLWNREVGTGQVFDSSAGFTLPNGAIRSPDASWISLERWHALPVAARQSFAPICPDFVVELRSPTDPLRSLRRKLREYIDQGARLGWLLDPIRGVVEVYRPAQGVEVLQHPATLGGEAVLPGFVLDLRGILDDLVN